MATRITISGTVEKRLSQARHNSKKLTEFMRLLQMKGPNVDAIAKEIGVHEETVRYWYKERMLKRGFVLQPTIDYARLGMRRVFLVVEVSPRYIVVAKEIFQDMASQGYLHYWASTLPYGAYILAPCVADECVSAYVGFLGELKKHGLFTKLGDVLKFDWWRNAPMDASMFNLKTRSWDVDLSRPRARSEIDVKRTRRASFDITDLRLLEQLQADANTRISDIAKVVGISYSGALRHYKHILDQRLVKMYRINWMNTAFVSELDKTMTGRHRYLALTVIVKDLQKGELENLISAFHKLPFLWGEAGGKHYECQLFIPLDLVNDVLTYLTGVLRPLRSRSTCLVENQNDAFASSIAPSLYDQKAKRWTFDSAAALARVDRLLLSVKEPR